MVKMIKNKIDQIAIVYKQVQNAQKAVNQYNSYNEFLSSLKAVVTRSKQCLEIYNLLSKYDAAKFGNLIFKDMIFKVDSMVNGLIDGELQKKNQIANFEQIIEAQENDLKLQWEKYASEKTSGIVGLIDSIKGLYDNKIKVTNLLLRLRCAKTKWPLDNDYIISFERDVAEGTSIIRELNAGSNIQRFLTLVALEQATIADVNDEILMWINDGKFATKIKLSFI
jgi:hypothetical protein